MRLFYTYAFLRGMYEYSTICYLNQMSERGAPEGNQNAVKNRPWAEAINRALLAENGKKLRALAERLIEKALEGDVAALKEIGDRADGKPKQQTELTGANGEPFIVRLEPQDSNL